VQQDQIFGPFFAMMLLTLAVWVFMFVVRIRFINSLGPVDLSVPGELARLSPPRVSNPSDNLKNLFEIPVLFYFLVLYLFVTNHVDSFYLACAWVFVAFRTLHSIVHCTFNHVMTRFGFYAVSSAAVWVMLIRAATA
jgi:hypothetical protein